MLRNTTQLKAFNRTNLPIITKTISEISTQPITLSVPNCTERLRMRGFNGPAYGRAFEECTVKERVDTLTRCKRYE